MKTDVDEDLIAPYMTDINRQFEYVDKEDIIKKMVSITFGRFLDYYKNAPEIVKPSTSRKGKDGEAKGKDGNGRRKGNGGERGPRKAESGYRRLFINLGKADGFYPGEIMQFVNHHIHGPKQEIGHIDLLSRFSYIEVPEQDAGKVMDALNGTRYKGREVRCNDADDTKKETRKDSRKGRRRDGGYADGRDGGHAGTRAPRAASYNHYFGGNDDWRALMQQNDTKLKGKEPDFTEEGWARRFPKKK